jgi:hypothetical protein
MATNAPPKRSPYQAPPPPAWPAWAALAGVGLLLGFGLVSWNKDRSESTALQARLANMEASIAALNVKVEQAARAARPARQGPDPDRVYTVKTAGSPSKGRTGAPIIIAEFSDFQ